MPTTQSNSIKAEGERTTVAIFGGGAGGIAVALGLADQGYDVKIYEKYGDLLLGSSNKTPGRAGLGFHYLDKNTAILYLQATIKVVRHYKDCMIGTGHDDDHYLRHGLYAIMKTKEELAAEKGVTVEELTAEDKAFASLWSSKEILETYKAIQEEYDRLVKEDPENEVFGKPEDFFKVIDDLSQYEGILNVEMISKLVDTREELVNWPKLRERLIKGVYSRHNISVKCNTTISSPRRDPESFRFAFNANDELEHADFVINSAWENVESLAAEAGFAMEPDSRTNRVKMILKVKLPESLRNHPSVFFCMGPHCMFSNMGDGYGMLTYAPETNICQSTGLDLDEIARGWLNKTLSEDEINARAQRLLAGAAKYVPDLAKAEIVNIGTGVIKTHGDVDLFDPKSDFHKRNYLGVEERGFGWINNSCTKLLHFRLNGERVCELVALQEKALSEIKSILSGLIVLPEVERIELVDRLYKYFSEKYLELGEDFSAEIDSNFIDSIDDEEVRNFLNGQEFNEEITAIVSINPSNLFAPRKRSSCSSSSDRGFSSDSMELDPDEINREIPVTNKFRCS